MINEYFVIIYLNDKYIITETLYIGDESLYVSSLQKINFINTDLNSTSIKINKIGYEYIINILNLNDI